MINIKRTEKFFESMESILIFLLNSLKANYYVEIKDKKFFIHPNEKNIIGLRNSSKPLRTQHQVQNETQFRKNQKTIRNWNNQLEIEKNSKSENLWKIFFYLIARVVVERFGLNLIKGFIVKIVNMLIINKNIRLIKK